MSKHYCVARIIDGVVNYLKPDGTYCTEPFNAIPAELKDSVLDAVTASVGTLYISQEVGEGGNGWALPIQIDRLIASQRGERIELDIVRAIDEYPSVGNKAIIVRFADDSIAEFSSGWVDVHSTSPFLGDARVFPINSADDLIKVKERFSAGNNGITLDVLVIFKGQI